MQVKTISILICVLAIGFFIHLARQFKNNHISIKDLVIWGGNLDIHRVLWPVPPTPRCRYEDSHDERPDDLPSGRFIGPAVCPPVSSQPGPEENGDATESRDPGIGPQRILQRARSRIELG